jgi:hypothetical protein
VTCIGLLNPHAAIVSGDLDTPITTEIGTLRNFSIIVVTGGDVIPDWILLGPDNLAAGLGPCGTELRVAIISR